MLAALWRDVHTGDHRVVFLEFKRGDQAVERLVGEGTFGLHLFAQRVSQIDIKTHDLVVGIQRLKRRVGGGSGETNGLGCAGVKGDAC
ncbi:hypothetical protein D3C73_1533840 [compost metagenome]